MYLVGFFYKKTQYFSYLCVSSCCFISGCHELCTVCVCVSVGCHGNSRSGWLPGAMLHRASRRNTLWVIYLWGRGGVTPSPRRPKHPRCCHFAIRYTPPSVTANTDVHIVKFPRGTTEYKIMNLYWHFLQPDGTDCRLFRAINS